MALITRSASAGIDMASAMFAPQVSGLVAGEALDVSAPCYIHTDGKVYMADATAADAKAKVAGWTPKAYNLGEVVTLFGIGAKYHYSDGLLTPGQILYVGATKGRLDAAATTGDSVGVAQAIDANKIRVTRNI
jgi:hypothetical protein